MPLIKRPTFVIRDPSLFGAVASARRMEIISSLVDAGPASIAELAERLGRSPHSLYYHMQLLGEARVVRSARKGALKKESVYELAARSIMLGPDPESKASIQATEHALDSILRLTTREVTAALRSGARRKGAEREVVGIRLKGRMTGKMLRSLNRQVNALERSLHRAGGSVKTGKLYALTIVLTPCL